MMAHAVRVVWTSLTYPTQYAMFILMFGIFKLVASKTLTIIDEHEYFLNEAATPVTWYEASRICMDNHGGLHNSHLAVLDTQDKIQNISDELMSVIGVHEAWLGAKPNKNINEWRFLNGTIIPAGTGIFEETSDSEIDGNCLTVQGSRYHVRNCNTRTASYLCEFNRPNNTFCLNMSGIMESVCVQMFNSTDISWFEARHECQDEGGDLASYDLTDKSLPGDFKGTAYVGAHRNPWWWTNPDSEMKYYKWQNGNETYRIYSCLATSRTGWVPRHCNNTMKYFICEANSLVESDQLMYIIIGSLVGGVLLLVIIIVVLVFCLRHARKKNEEVPDFQFHDVTSTSASSARTATIGTQASTEYENTERTPVQLHPDPRNEHSNIYHEAERVQLNVDPRGEHNHGYQEAEMVQEHVSPRDVHNYGYEEAEAVQIRKPRANPYASSSIDSVIERGSKVLNTTGADAKPKGTALHGLKKRLSLLMKREYQPSRDALPSAPATLQKGPDVVPMEPLGIYEDIGMQLRQTGGQDPGSPSDTSGYQTASDTATYSEVSNRRLPDDLVIVDNQHYAKSK